MSTTKCRPSGWHRMADATRCRHKRIGLAPCEACRAADQQRRGFLKDQARMIEDQFRARTPNRNGGIHR